MFGFWHLLVLLTVILCSSNQPAGEDFTVLTPRLVSKLLGTTKHVMLLINCNATHHHPPHGPLNCQIMRCLMSEALGDILSVFILLETLQRFSNKSHIFERKAGVLT